MNAISKRIFLQSRDLAKLPTVEEIRENVFNFGPAPDALAARVDVALEIHKARNKGVLCFHCGELAEDHGNFTDLCPYPHTTKFQALRCQFEVWLDATGENAVVCGARTVPGKEVCQEHESQ